MKEITLSFKKETEWINVQGNGNNRSGEEV